MQKEQLSALMDGELLDGELLSVLSGDKSLQQRWESYHLIRDTMRGDMGDILHLNIASKVMAAIADEPVHNTSKLITESQPEPQIWQKMPFWNKIRPWASQLSQVGLGACVSLAVIAGVQHYNNQPDSTVQPEGPVFNTIPIMGKASPVSLGVPSGVSPSGSQLQMQEQRRRINTMLQDYELQRRLHADQIQFEQMKTQQAAVQVLGNQTLGTQTQ